MVNCLHLAKLLSGQFLHLSSAALTNLVDPRHPKPRVNLDPLITVSVALESFCTSVLAAMHLHQQLLLVNSVVDASPPPTPITLITSRTLCRCCVNENAHKYLHSSTYYRLNSSFGLAVFLLVFVLTGCCCSTLLRLIRAHAETTSVSVLVVQTELVADEDVIPCAKAA